jgi:hypothetical protein
MVDHTEATDDNSAVSGDPVLTQTDDSIDFEWGDDTPETDGSGQPPLSTWTRTGSYAAGTDRLTATDDDGSRPITGRVIRSPGRCELHCRWQTNPRIGHLLRSGSDSRRAPRR